MGHRAIGSDPVIDEVYLPFSPSELAGHFAPVKARGEPGRHLAYYLASAKAAAEYRLQPAAGSPAEARRARVRGRQMEKDERFWVAAALMSLFCADGKDPLVRLLSGCLGEMPPVEGFSRWDEALGAKPELYLPGRRRSERFALCPLAAQAHRSISSWQPQRQQPGHDPR